MKQNFMFVAHWRTGGIWILFSMQIQLVLQDTKGRYCKWNRNLHFTLLLPRRLNIFPRPKHWNIRCINTVLASGPWVPMSVLLVAPTCIVRVDVEGEFHLQGPTVQQSEAVQATLPHTWPAGCVLNEQVISVHLRHTSEELRIPANAKMAQSACLLSSHL
jgi:hypothetical protein